MRTPSECSQQSREGNGIKRQGESLGNRGLKKNMASAPCEYIKPTERCIVRRNKNHEKKAIKHWGWAAPARLHCSTRLNHDLTLNYVAPNLKSTFKLGKIQSEPLFKPQSLNLHLRKFNFKNDCLFEMDRVKLQNSSNKVKGQTQLNWVLWCVSSFFHSSW